MSISNKTITDLAHRMCSKYKHNSPIATDVTKAEYTFNDYTLIDFVQKILEIEDEEMLREVDE